jgi:hypothetical protein
VRVDCPCMCVRTFFSKGKTVLIVQKGNAPESVKSVGVGIAGIVLITLGVPLSRARDRARLRSPRRRRCTGEPPLLVSSGETRPSTGRASRRRQRHLTRFWLEYQSIGVSTEVPLGLSIHWNA